MAVQVAHLGRNIQVMQAKKSSCFHEKNNRTPEQRELIRLRKEKQQLQMENGILKQWLCVGSVLKSALIYLNTN